MLEPILELTGPLNWNLAFKQSLVAVPDENERLGFQPIPRQNFLVDSNLLIVGCSSTTASRRWYRGCWISVNLLLGNIDSTSAFTGVTEVASGVVPLGRLKFFSMPAYKPSPYVVFLSVPRWISQLYVEAYWYDGPQSDNYLQLLEQINGKL